MADSSITISGNVTQDPTIRFTNTGKPVATISVAVNRRYQVNGEWQEETSFMNLIVWNDLGERAVASFSKGDRVIATGRFQNRQFTRKDGSTGTAAEIVVDDIGASVRWATVDITKASRSAGGFNQQRPAQQSDDANANVEMIKQAFAPQSSPSIDEPF